MQTAEFVNIGTLGVAAIVALTTSFHAGRSQARVEALAKAVELSESPFLDAESKKRVIRYVKFTAYQLGDVWWRTPIAGLGMVSLLMALGNFSFGLLQLVSADGQVNNLFWLSGYFALLGLASLLGAKFLQSHRGFA